MVLLHERRRAVAIGAAVALLVGAVVAGTVLLLRDGPDEPLVYVALGDSYTAGPLIEKTDEDDACLRSDHNYPSLLAERAGLDLVDVSCTGADSGNLVRPFELDEQTEPPQLDALDALDAEGRSPDLVTIGIGANDGDVSGIALTACAEAGEEDPLGSPCATADAAAPDPLLARVDKMRSDLTRLLGEVRERAPDAQVLVVGYPQVVPDSGTCRERLPLATDDYPWFREVNEALDDALRRAADDAGVDFVDVWAASEGHDVCSDEPWVNGQDDVPGIALAYHPLLAHQEAVADLVADAAGLDG